MADRLVANVQMPGDFDKARLNLLHKVAELSCKLGSHALATFADDSQNLHLLRKQHAARPRERAAVS